MRVELKVIRHEFYINRYYLGVERFLNIKERNHISDEKTYPFK